MKVKQALTPNTLSTRQTLKRPSALRAPSIMKSFGLAKKGIALAGMTIGFAMMGTGYGYLNDTLPIAEDLDTGSLALDFIGAFTNDDGLTTGGSVDLDDNGGPIASFDLHNDASSADPKSPGPQGHPGAQSFTARYGQDVARCSASRGPRATVLIENAYPGYWCTAWLDVQNGGVIPVKVKAIRLASGGTETLVTPADAYPAALDLDNSTQADIEVDVAGITLCQEIDPGVTVRMSIHHRVLAAAPQSGVLAYGVEVAFQQSGALSDLAADGECQPAGTTLD